jgi:hypothetical protein
VQYCSVEADANGFADDSWQMQIIKLNRCLIGVAAMKAAVTRNSQKRGRLVLGSSLLAA